MECELYGECVMHFNGMKLQYSRTWNLQGEVVRRWNILTYFTFTICTFIAILIPNTDKLRFILH